MFLLVTLVSWLFAVSAFGNVEKVIFTAPPTTILPTDAGIDNLLLIPLHHQRPTVRTYLNATFPTKDSPRGTESWLLLEGLIPGQRYEARVCWLATQPTNFWIYTHTISESFETPSLIASLSSYAYARHSVMSQDRIQDLRNRKQQESLHSNASSLMFLQIYAAADYYSLNKTLMRNVPPVLVDIILDPFLLNIFPKSLVPTATYITIIAFVAWFLSAKIFHQLRKNLSDQSTRQSMPVENKKNN